MQAKGALVVDVRTPEERSKTGVIPGNKGLTSFESKGVYHNEACLRQLNPLLASPNQRVILVRQSGNRSACTGAKVYQLKNGIGDWSAEHKPLELGRVCQTC